MFDINEQLAIYKFDLIHRCLNAKSKDSSYWKELREKITLLNTLTKRVKADDTIVCTKEMSEIKDFIAKTR
ncbi:MAG: hypothetical protein IJE04_02820 [Bacilli bacterium]|nr:hypothetical protein [Bacilli bacterium]